VNGAWIEIKVVVLWVMTPCSDVVSEDRAASIVRVNAASNKLEYFVKSLWYNI